MLLTTLFAVGVLVCGVSGKSAVKVIFIFTQDKLCIHNSYISCYLKKYQEKVNDNGTVLTMFVL